ncbi:hypothetical protein HNV12_14910 [Methanococcoides sp. SA1]|nr:hypothetical protein [Methanococcoides sp. SA1]
MFSNNKAVENLKIQMVTILLIIFMFSGTCVASESSVTFHYWVDGGEHTIKQLSLLRSEELSNCTDPESTIYDPEVVKAYGKITVENMRELIAFRDEICTIRGSSYDEMKPHMYPNGPIVTYGSESMNGYFWIKIYGDAKEEKKYSDDELDQIYKIVEKYANNVGVKNMPVVFTLTNNTQSVGYTDFPAALFAMMTGCEMSNCTNPNSINYESDVLKGYGKVPELEDIPENYTQQLQKITEKLSHEIETYRYPDGSVVSYYLSDSDLRLHQGEIE